MNAKEMLYNLPRAFDNEAAKDLKATVQFDTEDPVYHAVDGGRMEVYGGQADNPDVTIKISGEDLVKLVQGELNGMAAFMGGKLKVQGNMELAQQLVSLVDREKLTQKGEGQ